MSSPRCKRKPNPLGSVRDFILAGGRGTITEIAQQRGLSRCAAYSQLLRLRAEQVAGRVGMASAVDCRGFNRVPEAIWGSYADSIKADEKPAEPGLVASALDARSPLECAWSLL